MSLNNWHNTELAPEERAGLLLREMTLDEKMAQINCVFPFDKTYQDMDWIAARTPFGIGEVSTLEMRRIETLEAAADWQRTVQKVVMENSPHHIPAIFHMEGLCGAFIQEAASFPSGIARGAGFHPELEEEIGGIVGKQETACGITHILAPVLDISRDSRMGRQGESYGEDPALAAAMGAAYVRGLQDTRMGGRTPESVAKHFLAFHNSQGGIHGTHSDTPERLLREVYGKPFQAAIQAGLQGIMPCYCSINGEPASVSEKLLAGLLRKEMGFDGLCVSDYGGIGNSHTVQHIGETLAEAGVMALEAGMDVEMPSPAGYGKELRDLFANGQADVRLLDRAVLRVLTAKFRMGLFEHPFAIEDEALRKVFCSSRAREVTRQSARESLVLLKNDGILPLETEKVRKIALIGPHGDNARMFFGGYTHLSMMESTFAVANSIAGVAGIENTSGGEIKTVPGTNIQSDQTEEFDPILRRQKPDCPSLLAALRKAMPGTEIVYAYGYPIAGDDRSGFGEALELARDADAVLLTLGGKYGTCSIASMGEGVDGADINLPPCQDAFIREAAELGKPLVGVHFDGRPISSDTADRYLNAILEAWTPGEAGGEAVASALAGAYNPGGKLPVSVAYHAGQIPVYYNHPWGSCEHQGESIGFASYVDLPHTPRYPFGYGLSYTEFQYDDLRVSAHEVKPEEPLSISVEVRNAGKAAGDEVVQLYLSDCYASRTRPVQELAGFKRVHLEPGERKTVVFTVDLSQMAFLDKNMRWKIEKGAFEIRIGSSSADVRVSDTVRVNRGRLDQWQRAGNVRQNGGQTMNYFCNPVNVPYPYQFKRDPRDNYRLSVNREAADPSLVLFKGRYYLFASMSGAVWVSDNLAAWESVPLPENMPIYDYAPDVRVIGDWLYFTASIRGVPCSFYRTKDPIQGPYEEIKGSFDYWDPNLFLDDDGRLYFYWGCANATPIWGIELDPDSMKPVSDKVPLIWGRPAEHGYERFGEDNSENPRTEEEIDRLFREFLDGCGKTAEQIPEENRAMIRATFAGMPYIEGAWMTKQEGRYYLQYACPGAELNVYADGVYVSECPLGPFRPAESSPYSYKPGGFLPGAGHGSTMQDQAGSWWHTATMRISVNHVFERRVGLWPAGFDGSGNLFCNQRYGDWPMAVERIREDPWCDPEWFLLSYRKTASSSAHAPGKGPENAVDENVQTWWRAASPEPEAWLAVDLGEAMAVHAVQVNFADDPEAETACPRELVSGPDMARYIDRESQPTRWLLEASEDGNAWETLADKREASTDLSHDLVVSKAGVCARYVRLTVYAVPYGVSPCVSGLRVFGRGNGCRPKRAEASAVRSGPLDFVVSTGEDPDVAGYNVLWGNAPEQLYHSWMVMGTRIDRKRIGALVKGRDYYVRVDAFNENGITEGKVEEI